MNESTVGRQRYAASFGVCLLCISLYMMFQSMKGGLSQLDANLPGRSTLIAFFNRLRLKLGDHVFSEALVGKDGWLEYTGYGNSDDFQHFPILPVGGIQDIQSNLKLLYDKLRERNITLVVVIAPNKATIYPDKLPNQIQKFSPQSELDQLVNYMQQNGPPVLVDLRPALREARQKQDVYYKTDTHWNSYGAFVAYTEIMKALSGTYPALAPKKIYEFRLGIIPPFEHDIPLLMGVTNILETGYKLVPKHDNVNWVTYNDDGKPTQVSYSPQENLPELLMYHDSFGDALVPLMAPQFRKATFIDNISTYPDLLTFKEIDVTKPNIVILEFVERYQHPLELFLDHYGLNSQ